MLTGLDRAARDGLRLPGRGRVAVLCNATTVSADWVPTIEQLRALPGVEVMRILSPQHGFSAEKQDNMCESAGGVDPRSGVPIVSLYADVRQPNEGALSGIDALLIDVQDIGTRVYTFLTTAVYCLRAAARRGLPTIVLDRPNPIGDRVEGPLLDPRWTSFVGACAVPLRHGLTAGEMCRFAALGGLLPAVAGSTAGAPPGGDPAGDGSPPASRRTADDSIPGGLEAVEVVALEGWRREQYYDATGLPWTMPSPNMPTLETAVVYPGMVALEGTILSEGRGTTRPFELWGA
ncbi:MAG: DUF1343 domain-containing protein, partial [Candidatus Eisenbacteria bacterium]|nr:DUF1343 domain-containing protein [Candidatus Eisenbacteria bacterium]